MSGCKYITITGTDQFGRECTETFLEDSDGGISVGVGVFGNVDCVQLDGYPRLLGFRLLPQPWYRRAWFWLKWAVLSRWPG